MFELLALAVQRLTEAKTPSTIQALSVLFARYALMVNPLTFDFLFMMLNNQELFGSLPTDYLGVAANGFDSWGELDCAGIRAGNVE